MLISRTSQILPVPVESCDTACLKRLWIVRKTYLIADTVAAERVFTRFLQIDDDANVESKHLTDNVILLDQSSTWPLRTYKLVLYDI